MLALCALTILGGQTACKPRNQPAMMIGRPPAMVTVQPAARGDVPLYLERIGRMVAVETVTIVPQVSGKLTAVHCADGAFIRRGELLFEIDARPYEAALASAQAALAESRALLELARQEFERYRTAVAAAAVSQMEFDQKRYAVAVAEARVSAGEAAVATAKLNVEYTRIFSPIDGRAGARLVDPGNVVTANTSALLTIQQLDPIYAEFTIPENDLAEVRRYLGTAGTDLGRLDAPALLVQVRNPAESAKTAPRATEHAPAGPEEHAGWREGRLTFIDNAVIEGTGTVRLRATLANADGFFWPGQFVNVRLVLAVQKDAVLVPATAVQLGQQGPYVYVIRPGSSTRPAAPPAVPGAAGANPAGSPHEPLERGKEGPAPVMAVAEPRPIMTGQRQGDLVVVQQGLAAGELVVLTGQAGIGHDGAVMIMPAMPPGGIGGPAMVGGQHAAPASGASGAGSSVAGGAHSAEGP